MWWIWTRPSKYKNVINSNNYLSYQLDVLGFFFLSASERYTILLAQLNIPFASSEWVAMRSSGMPNTMEFLLYMLSCGSRKATGNVLANEATHSPRAGRCLCKIPTNRFKPLCAHFLYVKWKFIQNNTTKEMIIGFCDKCKKSGSHDRQKGGLTWELLCLNMIPPSEFKWFLIRVSDMKKGYLT